MSELAHGIQNKNLISHRYGAKLSNSSTQNGMTAVHTVLHSYELLEQILSFTVYIGRHEEEHNDLKHDMKSQIVVLMNARRVCRYWDSIISDSIKLQARTYMSLCMKNEETEGLFNPFFFSSCKFDMSGVPRWKVRSYWLLSKFRFAISYIALQRVGKLPEGFRVKSCSNSCMKGMLNPDASWQRMLPKLHKFSHLIPTMILFENIGPRGLLQECFRYKHFNMFPCRNYGNDEFKVGRMDDFIEKISRKAMEVPEVLETLLRTCNAQHACFEPNTSYTETLNHFNQNRAVHPIVWQLDVMQDLKRRPKPNQSSR
jgi:hypothetical protein